MTTDWNSFVIGLGVASVLSGLIMIVIGMGMGMGEIKAHALYVETSDRHGTSSIVAVFTDAAAAERAVEQAEGCYNRRAFIRTVPCDPAELPRVLGLEYRRH